MKNILIVLLATLALTSCTIREKIHINADGSGSYKTQMDMAGMLEQMGPSMRNDDGSHMKEKEVVLFSEFLDEKRDSIAGLPKSEQEALKAMEDMKMIMEIDTEAKIFDMEVGLDFKSIDDLKNIGEKVSRAQKLALSKEKGASQNPMTAGLDGDDSRVIYSMVGNKFTRKTNVLEKSENEPDESAAMFKDMLGESKYIIEYSFAKKIKSVNHKGAVLSEDKKSFTVEHKLSDYFDNPTSLDLEVEFQ